MVGPIFIDVEEDVFPNTGAQVPLGVVVAFEFIEHVHRILDTESVFGGEIVIEREIPFRVFVIGQAVFFRFESNWTVLA